MKINFQTYLKTSELHIRKGCDKIRLVPPLQACRYEKTIENQLKERIKNDSFDSSYV